LKRPKTNLDRSIVKMGQTFDKNELKETPKNTSHTKNRANSKFASITIKDKKFDTLGADFKQSFNP